MSHFGLKMLIRHFSSKNEKNNFSGFRRIRGIPDREKLFFDQNFFFRRAILSPSLNIFWRDRWQMKDNSIWHIAMKRKVDILPQGAGNLPKRAVMQHDCTFRRIPGPLRRNVNFSLHSYVPNRVIFHLPPVSSKNVERRRQNSASKKKIWSKNNFSRSGIPRIRRKLEKLFFFIFWRKMPNKHFKTKMGHFGCKMEVWRLWQAR